MSTLSEKFQNILNDIGDAVTDFTTLDVLTISGDIKTVINKENKFLKPVELIKDYNAATSVVKVEAFTHVDFDQDVIQFFRDGIKEDDLTYKLHQQAVESSKTARLAVLNFIKEMIP